MVEMKVLMEESIDDHSGHENMFIEEDLEANMTS